MTPEEKARQIIDENLHQAGWVIQDYKQLNLGAARGVAIREVPLRSGTCDYLLVVDRQPVGVVEAKRTGTRLSGVAEQSGDYASNLPDFLRSTGPLPFLYESTGVETFYRDERDPDPRSRRVFTFHRPETLAELAKDARTLRARLAEMSCTRYLVLGSSARSRSSTTSRSTAAGSRANTSSLPAGPFNFCRRPARSSKKRSL